jgi:uncharacterized protein (TIGR02145 family)
MEDVLKCSVLIVSIQLIFMFNSCKKDEPHPVTTVTDIDGNLYNIITIGTQQWMKENLRTTRYLNGELIGTTTPSTFDIILESTPKYQWAYGGSESNALTYGRLYTWYAATDSRKLCPSGWHVSSDDEWTTLTTFLSGEAIAGGKLKESGTTHWLTPNMGATNEIGFSALPGGSRFYWGDFGGIGIFTDILSSTEKTDLLVIVRNMAYNYNFIDRAPRNKSDGMSVRCIKD